MYNEFILFLTEGDLAMNELLNKKAVEHNDLVNSVVKMEKIPLKIFELAVSQIDTDNPPKDNTIYLSKKLIFSFFDVNSSSKHTRFKKVLANLHKQSVFEIREVVKNGKWEFKTISPLESSSWNNYNDVVQIQFTNSIMPYLIDLKENFTQYLITDIMKLNSKYSVILYKILSMNFNQYENYKDSNKRTDEQLEKLKNPYIDIEELRRITNTVNEYSRMFDFEKNVLQTAADEITRHTHLKVEYEKIKKGRSVIGCKFYIDKKHSKATLPYKENDIAYEKSKEVKKQEKEALYTQAMQSKYTTILGENFLLNFKEMQDIDLMASLQKNVYPLYEELKKIRGLEGVKVHINYVSTHQEDYSDNKKNIVRYLKRAIDQYLVTVKLQDIE